MIKHLKSGVHEYYTSKAFIIDFKATALLEVYTSHFWKYEIPSARKLLKEKPPSLRQGGNENKEKHNEYYEWIIPHFGKRSTYQVAI